MALVPNIKYKTEYCLYWQQEKVCEKGDYCFFAHGDYQLRSIEEVNNLTLYAYAQQNHKEITLRNTQAGLIQTKLPNYKTVFCKFYAQGQCRLGDECTYAHERREKRKKKASLEHQMQTTYPQANMNTSQNYDFYNPYYYQQFYQNYMYTHNWPQSQQAGTMHYEWQMCNEDYLSQKIKVEDINQSGQYNKIITLNNSKQAEQKSEHTLELQNSGEMSPTSTSTTSPVHLPLPSLKITKSIEQRSDHL